MKAWRIITIALLSGFLNACVHDPRPYISDLPFEMRFSVMMITTGKAGFGEADVTYQITRDGYISATTKKDARLGRPVRSYRVTTAGWRKFLNAVRPLELAQWKPSYHYEMTDGWSWELSMVVRQEKPFAGDSIPVYAKVISSEGENAGPVYGNPSKTSSGLTGPRSGEMFLADALSELWRNSKKP